jgi:hypothetical protein
MSESPPAQVRGTGSGSWSPQSHHREAICPGRVPQPRIKTCSYLNARRASGRLSAGDRVGRAAHDGARASRGRVDPNWAPPSGGVSRASGPAARARRAGSPRTVSMLAIVSPSAPPSFRFASSIVRSGAPGIGSRPASDCGELRGSRFSGFRRACRPLAEVRHASRRRWTQRLRAGAGTDELRRGRRVSAPVPHQGFFRQARVRHAASSCES